MNRILDPEAITSKLTKVLGSLVVIKPVLDRLKVSEIIDKYCPMERDSCVSHGKAVEIAIINRLMSPRPLYKIEDWAKDIAIEEIYGIFPEKLNDDRIGRALDAIYPHIEEIEAEICTRAITEFKISSDIVHFDLTSLYFEGEYEETESITYGYSRDHRPDKKQINLGLNVSGSEGIPFLHEVYDGNTSDAKTVIKNMEKLRNRLNSSHIIMVGDRGLITPENIIAFSINNSDISDIFQYIGTLKLENEHKELIKSISENEFKLLDYSRNKVKYYGVDRTLTFEYKGKKVDARGLVLKSDKKVEKDAKNRAKGINKILEKLEHIKSKLNQRKYKKREYVEKQIDKAMNGTYKKYIDYSLHGMDGELSLDYGINQGKVESDAKLDGKYIIVSNVYDYSKSKLLQTYKSRFIVESRIRNMKSDIKVRPIFLHTEQRIRSLVFITILALMVYSILEVLCRRNGMNITTRTLFYIFGKLSLIRLRTKYDQLIVIEDLNYYQNESLNKLHFPKPEVYIENCC